MLILIRTRRHFLKAMVLRQKMHKPFPPKQKTQEARRNAHLLEYCRNQPLRAKTESSYASVFLLPIQLFGSKISSNREDN